MLSKLKAVGWIMFLVLPGILKAQSNYLPFDKYQYYQRVLQVSGLDSANTSYQIRPAFSDVNPGTRHPWRHLGYGLSATPQASIEPVDIYYYEPVWFHSLNTSLPRGMNDGPIWQGKGYNTAVSFGIQAEYGILTLRYRPIAGYYQNNAFDLGPYDPPPVTSRFRDIIDEPATEYAYRDFQGRVDYVQRYGEDSSFWTDLGESSIELNYRQARLALSSQQLWTGPAVHSSLQLGYNAPGIRHLYAGTNQPVKTPVGTFEAAYIFGKMRGSGYLIEGRTLTQSINTIVVSYSPPFTDRFHIGGMRTFYHHYPESFSEYRNMASKLVQFLFRSSYDDWDPDNQVANLFFRYRVPVYNLEFYGEFARNDHNADTRDFRAQFNHARAFTLGFIRSKILRVNRILALNVELTQTESMRSGLTRGEGQLGGWYTHNSQVLGVTNRGQVMGSGYGPGFNSQTLKLDYFDHRGHAGLRLARVARHNGRIDQFFQHIQDVNDDEVERWEVRNTELILGLEMTAFLMAGIELSAVLERSYIYNMHNLKDNDMRNVRFEIQLRKNMRGWLR